MKRKEKIAKLHKLGLHVDEQTATDQHLDYMLAKAARDIPLPAPKYRPLPPICTVKYQPAKLAFSPLRKAS